MPTRQEMQSNRAHTKVIAITAGCTEFCRCQSFRLLAAIIATSNIRMFDGDIEFMRPRLLCPTGTKASNPFLTLSEELRTEAIQKESSRNHT